MGWAVDVACPACVAASIDKGTAVFFTLECLSPDTEQTIPPCRSWIDATIRGFAGVEAQALRLALAAAAFGTAIPIVRADCAQPTIDTSELRVRGRAPITVRGESWAEGCSDTESCTVGCLGCPGDEPSPPARDIQLILRPINSAQDGAGVELATGIDADAAFAFEVFVSIPAFVEPGRYVIYGEHRWRSVIDVYAGPPIVVVPGRGGAG